MFKVKTHWAPSERVHFKRSHYAQSCNASHTFTPRTLWLTAWDCEYLNIYCYVCNLVKMLDIQSTYQLYFYLLKIFLSGMENIQIFLLRGNVQYANWMFVCSTVRKLHQRVFNKYRDYSWRQIVRERFLNHHYLALCVSAEGSYIRFRRNF
jgi:hypothetical protein